MVVVHCLPASVWNKAHSDKHRYGGEGAGARLIGHPTGFFSFSSPQGCTSGRCVCGSTILGIVYDTAKPLISCLRKERISNLQPPVEESASQEQKRFEANYRSLVQGEERGIFYKHSAFTSDQKKNAALGGARITVPTSVVSVQWKIPTLSLSTQH